MKLKTLLAQHGITQTELARLLGRDKSVVTNLLQGRRQLKADEAAIISQALSVPVAEILGLRESAPGVAEVALIPFQAEPAHTRKARPVVRRQGQYYLEESGFSPKAYALEVRDESMNLAGILPGDIVISELDRACQPGQIIIVQHYDGADAQTVLRRYEPPFLLSHSTNPVYRSLHCKQDDVRLVSPVLKLIRLL